MNFVRLFNNILSILSQYLSAITVRNISQSFTDKMAAKINWQRYRTKLRHCYRMCMCAQNIYSSSTSCKEQQPTIVSLIWSSAGTWAGINVMWCALHKINFCPCASGAPYPQPIKWWHWWQLIRYDTRCYWTCARKPTRVSLIYRTEPTTKKCKTEKNYKVKTDMLKSNSKQSGESM